MSARTSPCSPISQPEAGEAVSSCTPRQTVRNTTAGSRAVLVPRRREKLFDQQDSASSQVWACWLRSSSTIRHSKCAGAFPIEGFVTSMMPFCPVSAWRHPTKSPPKARTVLPGCCQPIPCTKSTAESYGSAGSLDRGAGRSGEAGFTEPCPHSVAGLCSARLEGCRLANGGSAKPYLRGGRASRLDWTARA